MKKIDWIIHFVANGACDDCGKEESGFINYACNAHTHGMERYGHKDFQLVLRLPMDEVGRILNTFGAMVQSGRSFHSGELVTGIYEDCPVRLDEFEETGRQVLRVVIPDKYNAFPEDERCMDTYRLQLLPTDSLYRKGGMTS